MNYTELKTTDCSKYVGKKGKFNYISWPYMVDQLRIHLPEATIHARQNPDGMPYFLGNVGAMVETYILLDEKEIWNEWLPVMDFKNKAITNPNAMDINKAIQRCKAKCISEYLGIGLYLYMGEDLPEQAPVEPKQITIGENNVSWLVDFCNRNHIKTQKDKKHFQDHYKFDPYVTSEKDFTVIAEIIDKDYADASV